MAIVHFNKGDSSRSLAKKIVDAVFGKTNTAQDRELLIQGTAAAIPINFFINEQATRGTETSQMLCHAMAALTSLRFGNNITCIADYAFYRICFPCLRRIHFGNVQTLGICSFASTHLPQLSVLDLGCVSTIRDCAFASSIMHRLCDLDFQDVHIIDQLAFHYANLSGLRTLHFRHVCAIGHFAFECANMHCLKTLDFGCTESIGRNAFYQANLACLTCLDLHNVCTIHDCAFAFANLASAMRLIVKDKTILSNQRIFCHVQNLPACSAVSITCDCHKVCNTPPTSCCHTPTKAIIVFEDCCLDWTRCAQALLCGWQLGVSYAWCGRKCIDSCGCRHKCGAQTYIQMSSRELKMLEHTSLHMLSNTRP